MQWNNWQMDIPITLLEFLIETLFHVAFEREKEKEKRM
jgi:hypothetical protein